MADKLIFARRLASAPFVFIGPDQPGAPLGPATHLADALGGRPAWTLVFVTASLEVPDRRARLVDAWRCHAAAHPAHRVIILCNGARELLLLQRAGVAAVLCNHNIVVDDTVFTIVGGEAKRHDAIYNARMMAYKRHALARAIESLALLYYDADIEPGYFESVRRALPRAVLINEEAARAAPARAAHPRAQAMANRLIGARGFVKLPPAEVARQLNRARVGLCLSAEEGAMLASVEYLLCGLPVVSTAGLGGRDFFFDPDFTRVVADDPDAIAAAVAEFVRRDIDPAAIRARTLWTLRHERDKFAAMVRAILAEAGAEPQLEIPFARLFAESLFARSPIGRLLAPAAGQGPR